MTEAEVTEVLTLAQAAAARDAVAPLSEHVLLHVRYEGRGDDAGSGTDLLVTRDGRIAGYAYLNPPPLDPATQHEPPDRSGELVVHPDDRRHGLGLELVRALAAAADGYPIRLWAHGDLPAAAALARAAGFERFRALWQMRRPLSNPVAEPAFPAGTTLRTFRPGQDEDAWLALNARAFAGHPEQGTWTRHDLELREREPWFDPAGFFIAERHGAMAGFHWTKVHGPADAPGSLGEVYVVGVDPGEQGTGLGRALTLAGLRYLRDRGLAEVMLYTDEDNAPAIRLYGGLGFTRFATDAMYRPRELPARASCLRCRAPHRAPRTSAAGRWPPPRSAPRRTVRSHRGPPGREHEDPAAGESCSPPVLLAAPSPCAPRYVPTLLLRMTHQGHSPTTFTCGFTQLSGNDSAKLPRSSRQSGKGRHKHHIRIPIKSTYMIQQRSLPAKPDKTGQ
jgi:mycothiol synthase